MGLALAEPIMPSACGPGLNFGSKFVGLGIVHKQEVGMQARKERCARDKREKKEAEELTQKALVENEKLMTKIRL